jgi:hypothetical protein
MRGTCRPCFARNLRAEMPARQRFRAPWSQRVVQRATTQSPCAIDGRQPRSAAGFVRSSAVEASSCESLAPRDEHRVVCGEKETLAVSEAGATARPQVDGTPVMRLALTLETSTGKVEDLGTWEELASRNAEFRRLVELSKMEGEAPAEVVA